MARLLVRSGATVPELFDREIFLKQISPSRYELWVGTPSGEETPIAANSQIGGVEGLEDLLGQHGSDLAAQLATINAIIGDLYGVGGTPGGGIPPSGAFPSMDAFNSLTATVSGLGVAIDAFNGSLATRAFQVDVAQIQDDLGGIGTRLTAAETSISQNAVQIALKASLADLSQVTDDVGDVTTRLTAAEASITVNASQIALKASQADLVQIESIVGDIDTRLTTAESSITVQAGQIALKASQSDLTQLETDLGAVDARLTTAEASITVNAAEIANRVTTSTFTSFLSGDFDDALARISTAETLISQKADSVSVSALQTAFNALGDTVGQNSAEIQVLSNRISSQVTGTIIGNVDGNLSGTRTSIPLQAGTPVRLLDGDLIKVVSIATGDSAIYTVDSGSPVEIGATSIPIVSATVVASDGDVVVIDGIQILSRIDQFGNQISAMVTQTYVDGQVSLLQTQISQTETDILLQAAALGANDAIGTTTNTSGSTINLSSGLLIDLKEGDKITVLTKPSNAVVVRTVTANANAGSTSVQVNSGVTSEAGGVIRRVEQGGASLISLINVAPGVVEILSEKINLSGFVTFSGFADAFSTNVTTIDGGKIATGSITANKLAAGVIEAASIAAGSITADKIAANAVTASKINAGAVTADKIAAGAITADKIAAGTITADKLAAGVVEAASIATGSITADKIAAGAVTADKLSVTGEFFVNAINSYGGVLKINADKVQFSGSGGIEVTDPAAAINVGTTKILWNKIEVSAIESGNWGLGAGMQIDLTNGTIRTGGSSNPKFSVGVDGGVTLHNASIILSDGVSNTIYIEGGSDPIIHSSPSGAPWLIDGFEISKMNGIVGAIGRFASLHNPSIQSNSTGIGFYGTAVQTKKTVSGDTGGNEALNALLVALRDYGLINLSVF